MRLFDPVCARLAIACDRLALSASEEPGEEIVGRESGKRAIREENMNQITQFVISHGGLFLFVAGFAEQSGLPFPGGLCLVAAGALAAGGKFSLIAAIGWATAGCVAADAIWFFLGQRTKARVLHFFPHLRAVQVKLNRATLTRTVLHGMRMLTVAKFVPFGNVIPMHAGALEVSRVRFLVVDAFTSVVYAAVYAALGFAFHKQLEQVVTFFRKLGSVSLLLVAVLAGAYVVQWYRKDDPKKKAESHSEQRKAERNICLT
jgi:membrane protein DedA with SNARE-associated domain